MGPYQLGLPQWYPEGLAGTSSPGHVEGPQCPVVVEAPPVARVLKTS